MRTQSMDRDVVLSEFYQNSENNSKGSWFSTNCSEEVSSICMDVFQQQNMYLLPKILPAISSTNLTLTTGRQLLITCSEELPYTPPCPE